MKGVETWVLEYLVNSVWQVPVVFAVTWALARAVRRAGPGAEHRLWVGALLVEVALPGCPARLGEIAGEVLRTLLGALPWGLGGVSSGVGARIAVAVGGGAAHGMPRLPEAVLGAIAMTYLAGLVFFAGRLGWGAWRVAAAGRQSRPVVLAEDQRRMWERCLEGFGLGAGTGIAMSGEVAGPVTVGFVRGLLLVPPGFLQSVGDEDLQAVFAHECAHLQRRDFLKNLAYGVLTLPAAYHPALWLTRSRVSESREMVCDALAAEAVAGRERYARSLLRLAAMLAHGRAARTLHAIGILDANRFEFERRVMQLTEKQGTMKGVQRAAITALCLGVGAATCGSALALRVDGNAPAAATQTAASGRAKVSADVMQGSIVYKKNPVYPVEAKAKKQIVDGPVVLAVVVGKDGTVEQLRVAKSLRADYDRSAIDAVREWRWKPYLLNGQPTEVETTVTVTYSTAP